MPCPCISTPNKHVQNKLTAEERRTVLPDTRGSQRAESRGKVLQEREGANEGEILLRRDE